MLKQEIESLKNYIREEIEKRGFKNNQIEIDFAGLGEKEEIFTAAQELGYEIEVGKGQGVYWVYEEV
jgi:hypothetical protein